MIDVLLVDDSAIIRAILKQILDGDSRFKIVGEAANGRDAITMNKMFRPHLIIMDVNMPVMDGIEATRVIMKENPTSIVIFSTEDSAKIGFEGINAGAVEIIEKPSLSVSSHSFYENFKEKLFQIGSKQRTQHGDLLSTRQPEVQKNNFDLVMIGASTGGPQAVQTVLKQLGKDLAAPILVTQHIDASFARHYVPWLSETTGMNVKFAEEAEICRNGHVYVAPPDYHLTVKINKEGKYYVSLNKDAEVHFLRPAVDPMFFSGAQVAGKSCIAILLTGMGRDGADGCKELLKKSGFTICESEESCAVFGMPKAAIEEGGASLVLPAGSIGSYVRKMINQVKE